MVHNSKALTASLERFVLSNVCGHRAAFRVSDVKRDDTVFVRFWSSPGTSSDELSTSFAEALFIRGYDFTRVDDRTFRLGLAQFGASHQ